MKSAQLSCALSGFWILLRPLQSRLPTAGNLRDCAQAALTPATRASNITNIAFLAIGVLLQDGTYATARLGTRPVKSDDVTEAATWMEVATRALGLVIRESPKL